ncbi:O-antigen polymerase [Shewanella algae]|uniref:O-antigen polymerase n=1 Tax=Shewanella algae TaxID=38313 RepID=UPI001AAF7B8C|nr:O-antigen polysaccharide polymerase Wzy [Shewanella algae]MBO2550339.1 O-antigen polysaccharide polymerase Wzy [Shewanella algae]
MIEIQYLLSLAFVLFVLKKHPASLVFVFLVNFFSGFTPMLTTFVNYELVYFDSGVVLELIFAFNLSISIFHLIYLSMKRRRPRLLIFKKYKYSRVIMYFLSLAVVLVVYQNVNQGFNVISSGYVSGYKGASEQTVKATSFFPFVLIFYFLLFTYFLREGKKIYVFLMICLVFSYFMYGSRSFFLYTSISIVVFLILIGKMTYTRFAILSSVALPFIIIAGAIREGDGGGEGTILFRLALEMANIPMIISNLSVLDNLEQSIIDTALSALPHAIIVPLGVSPVNSLATEFVNYYDPGWAKAGGGFGFTIIGEIYYRFGYLGLIIVPYLIVIFLHNLEDRFLKGDEFDKALIMTNYFGMLMWIRGDFIEISRLLLVVILFYYLKRLVYRREC